MSEKLRKKATKKVADTAVTVVTAEPKGEALKGKKLVAEIIRVIIFSISLGALSFALTGLAVIGWGYISSQMEYNEINNNVEIGSVEYQPQTKPQNPSGGDSIVDIDTSTPPPYIPIKVDEEYYKAVNSDYAFFMHIPGTNVNYPVVHSPEKDHYLRYTFKGTENMAGAVSIDYRTPRGEYFNDFDMVISAHNRQDGTMFSSLVSYYEESFRDQYPYIYIAMGDKEYIFEVYACYLLKPVSAIYTPEVSYEAYKNIVLTNTVYDKKPEIKEDDINITLYTCNDDSSMRYLVHAKLVYTYDN